MDPAGKRSKSWVVQALRDAAWAPLLVFLAHVLISRVLGLYLLFPSLDVPVHLLGGAAIAYFFSRSCRAAAQAGLIGQPDRLVYSVLVFALAGTASVLWEFVEFLSDRFFGTHAQLGLEDTLLDMALGMVGAFAFVLASHPRRT